MLCKSVGNLGSRSKSMPGGHLFCWRRDTCTGVCRVAMVTLSFQAWARAGGGLGQPSCSRGLRAASRAGVSGDPGSLGITRDPPCCSPCPRPSVGLLPFQPSFFMFNFFPSFFSNPCLALPCLACLCMCKEHRPLNQKILGPDPAVPLT